MTNKINGIDVSESVLTATNNDVYYSQKAVDELQNNIKRLQKENEGLKSLNDFNVQKIEVLKEENEKLYKALEEIRNEIGDLKNINRLINLQKILDIINEAFGNE